MPVLCELRGPDSSARLRVGDDALFIAAANPAAVLDLLGALDRAEADNAAYIHALNLVEHDIVSGRPEDARQRAIAAMGPDHPGAALLESSRETSKQLQRTHAQVAEAARLLDPEVTPDAWGLNAAANKRMAELAALKADNAALVEAWRAVDAASGLYCTAKERAVAMEKADCVFSRPHPGDALLERLKRLEKALAEIAEGMPGSDATYVARGALKPTEGA